MNEGLTSSPGGPISPGGPLWSRYILPSEPWINRPYLDSVVRQWESSLSTSLVTSLALWSLITDLQLWGKASPEGTETMRGESRKASLDISCGASIRTFTLSVRIPGSFENPNEGVLASLSRTRLVTLAEGFPGNGQSAFLSVVMLSSTGVDDSSGSPLWLSRCPFLVGIEWRLTFPLLWKRPVSSSTKTRPPWPADPPDRLNLDSVIPSRRKLPCFWNACCCR